MSDEALTTQCLQFHIHADDWRDALTKGAAPLLANGSITPRYVERMIEAVEKIGPYIVIAPGIALGHARPDESVLKTGIAISTLSDPVAFGSPNDPVDIVIVLASIDQNDHIDKLSKIATFLGTQQNLQLLRSATGDTDAATILERINGR